MLILKSKSERNDPCFSLENIYLQISNKISEGKVYVFENLIVSFNGYKFNFQFSIKLLSYLLVRSLKLFFN